MISKIFLEMKFSMTLNLQQKGFLKSKMYHHHISFFYTYIEKLIYILKKEVKRELPQIFLCYKI